MLLISIKIGQNVGFSSEIVSVTRSKTNSSNDHCQQRLVKSFSPEEMTAAELQQFQQLRHQHEQHTSQMTLNAIPVSYGTSTHV